jgi:dolichol-phosphate mannosyltransferase
MGGLTLSTLGVLGLYVGKVFNEVKERPLYVVKDLINFENTDTAASSPVEISYAHH